MERERVAVLGAGPGGLAIAADLAAAGRQVVLADVPGFAEHVEAVRAAGGVRVAGGWFGERVVPVEAADDVAGAVAGAGLIVISVRAVAHERFVELALPVLRPGATVLFMGEGGGALVAARALRAAGREDAVVGETNALPFISRAAGPGAVSADRKRGGVLAAAVPAGRTGDLIDRVRDVWPFLEPAASVWETALLNYDAIDTVPVVLANAGTVEGRPGGIVLWGEGATPAVVRVIEAIDRELGRLRRALGSSDDRGYRELLIGQGLAPDVGPLYDVMRAGGIVRSVRPSGSTEALERMVRHDTAWTLVLASSLGDSVGVDTPAIDAVITLVSVMLGADLREEGRTVASLGLGGLDATGLRVAVGL